MKYIKRDLESTFLQANASFKAILVTGARQIGKSSMLEHLAKNESRTIVTMDKSSYRELAQSDPELFFQTFKPPIMIDEIQKAPALFEHIKMICDQTNDKGLFWLTGSESKKLLDEAQDSLAGRVAILKMYAFSEREKNGHTESGPINFRFESLSEKQKKNDSNDIHKCFDSIWHGSMPDAQNLNAQMLDIYFDSYIENYLMRDAVDDNKVQDTEGFRKFLRACAAFAGHLLNYSDLANAASISQTTAKEWIKILQHMGIVYLLEPYSSNELRRLIKTPKLYFCDTGLCAYLSKWQTKEALMSGAASGHYYENYVIMEIVKNLSISSPRAMLSFYRDKDGKEIDLLIEDENGMHPIEIKLSTNPNITEIKKFRTIEKVGIPNSAGGIICMCKEPLPIDSNNCLIPSNLI